MKGIEVITELKKKFKKSTDRELAEWLGMSIPCIQKWKIRPNVTPRQFAGLVDSASRKGAVRFQSTVIRPLVEFFPINACDSRRSAKREVFDARDVDGNDHPYLSGLRRELEEKSGVYLFFDSRGQMIYAGKARKQSLWKEINSVYNRPRGDAQKIRRVDHPNIKIQYRTSNEKARQITEHEVQLHELAAYFSAYDVTDTMIDDLEALLVRSFANHLLNIRMEQFSRQRRKLQ
jgi:hypothetical protein